MKRKLWLILCLMVCLISVGTFGNKNRAFASESSQMTEDEKSYLKQFASDYVSQWNSFDFAAALDQGRSSMDEATITEYENWVALKKELGNFVEIVDTVIEEEGTILTLTTEVKYENGEAQATIVVDQVANTQVFSIQKKGASAGESVGENMEKAALNTLMGMGVVFLALIFISLIIGLLKYVPKLVENFQKKENTIPETIKTEETVMPEPVMEEEEDLTDDLELAAVITAAIAASMGEEVPSDGLVVRSIRRRKSSNWQSV